MAQGQEQVTVAGIPHLSGTLNTIAKLICFTTSLAENLALRLIPHRTINPILMTPMLAAVDKGRALKLLLNRTNPQLYRKFYRREMYLEDIATRSGDPDDFIIDGYATHAEAIDLRIDIEKVITEMVEKYMDSLPHLAALYYITTEVGPDDAAAIAGRSGTKKCWWLTRVVKPMREELCEKLELFKPHKQT